MITRVFMVKIFDCSNSKYRPKTRNLGGPVMNEFVKLMHDYAGNYDCKFVENLYEADVVFTNDVFTPEVLATNLPRVKRMDGIFWQKNLFERNLPYVEACKQSDKVIFISKYSRDGYYRFFHEKLNDCVVHHWTKIPVKHDTIFYQWERLSSSSNFSFLAIATDWSRPEKRLSEIIKFAEMFLDDTIILVGKCNKKLPKNIYKTGYLNIELNEFITLASMSNAFLNLTCKDAATK